MSAGHITVSQASGRIDVSPSAIGNIASATVLECYGVVGIAGKRNRGGRAQLLDEGHYDRGVAVAVQDGRVVVDVYVVVEYGTRISEVAHNVIIAVGSAIQRTIGEIPVRVNVNVQGLRISA